MYILLPHLELRLKIEWQWLNYIRKRIILKAAPFQILLNFHHTPNLLQPSFNLLLRRRVPSFLHSHVISQTWGVWISWERGEDTERSVGAECQYSVQSHATVCHGDCCMRDLEAAYPTLYQSWLLSLVQILTQKCQKIKHPTYIFQRDNIKSFFPFTLDI